MEGSVQDCIDSGMITSDAGHLVAFKAAAPSFDWFALKCEVLCLG